MDSDPKVQKLMVQTLMRKDVYSKVRNSDFSPDQLKSYFDENREDFVVPEKVQVRRILIKVDERRTEADALKLAGELRAQIEAAPDRFKELAQQNSEDPYRKRGGDLGFLSKDGKPGVPSEVTAKAFDMDVGGLSEAFVAGGGVNLVTVVNKRERVERTYEQMKGSVLRKVKNERYKELYDEYVESIRSKHKTTMESGVLDTVELEPKRRFSAGGGPGMNPGKPPMIQLPQKPPQGAGNK